MNLAVQLHFKLLSCSSGAEHLWQKAIRETKKANEKEEAEPEHAETDQPDVWPGIHFKFPVA